jgi:hypothetical protein
MVVHSKYGVPPTKMAIPPTREKPIRPARNQRRLSLVTGFSGIELAEVP